MVWNKIKGIFSQPELKVEIATTEIPSALISQEQHSEPKKIKKKTTRPKVKKKPVEVPPEINNPKPDVKILKFDFDPANPKMGSLELDWNKEFIKLLIDHGYRGSSDEELVDKWLNDVCRNIALNSSEMLQDNVRYIQRKDLGDGKTEFS
jgi:hypothetical protein